jgi:hypothetical protein
MEMFGGKNWCKRNFHDIFHFKFLLLIGWILFVSKTGVPILTISKKIYSSTQNY